MADKEKSAPEEQSADTNAWMVTFSDLLTLMITFFVLLLTMSSMDDKKLKAISSTFSDSLGVLEMGKGGEVKKIKIIEKIEVISQDLLLEMSVIRNLLDEAMSGAEGTTLDKLRGSADWEGMVTMDDRGVVVTFSDAILFEPGSMELNKEAFPIVDKLARRLAKAEFMISVEGHTDASPAAEEGGGNWFISARRAVSVMRYLNRAGVGMERLSARGYASYSPLVENDTPENRARNRRVELILSKNL